MANCRNCGTAIVPDPTDPESLVHSWSQDAQCIWYGRELDSWAEGPSEVEKQQAKMRLVRLNAEGNPVDGSVQYFIVDKFYAIGPEPDESKFLDQQMRNYFLNKETTITLKDIDLSDEVRRLLYGGEYEGQD